MNFKNDQDRWAFARELEDGDGEAIGMAEELLKIRAAGPKQYSGHCGCCSPGYILEGGYLPEGSNVQRCDDCAKFPDDDAAAVQWVKDLEAGEHYARALAYQILNVLYGQE